MENVEKLKFWLVKVLFLISYFITNFFSTHYVHFYLIRFYDQIQILQHTPHYASYAIILLEKYEKLRTKRSCSWKRAFPFNKKIIQKDNSEGQVGVVSFLIGSCFWNFLANLRKKFQKGHFLTKRPLPGRFIFLK